MSSKGAVAALVPIVLTLGLAMLGHAHAYGVNLWMSQSFYRMGDTIIVYWDFRCGPNGGMTLTFVGPYTTSTGGGCWDFVDQGYLVVGIAEPQDAGNWVVYGEFTFITDIVPLTSETYYAQTSFTVESAVVVTETITLTRTKTQTEIQPSYTETTQHVTKSGRTTVTYTETETADAQTVHVTLDDTITKTGCSPTITTTLLRSQNQQTPSTVQFIFISFLALFVLLLPGRAVGLRKSEVNER